MTCYDDSLSPLITTTSSRLSFSEQPSQWVVASPNSSWSPSIVTKTFILNFPLTTLRITSTKHETDVMLRNVFMIDAIMDRILVNMRQQIIKELDDATQWYGGGGGIYWDCYQAISG
ncbi:hypothetical protein HAX54_031176 [Datura stramonium]|uniref:Uncharacterized protein n=1 Tax=Datura stramonium TaxID=4076 RepID=A0ABS8SBQ8_DATST|nr:hypothetical protein [Datura stramonium]